jgi:hypothetical protein
MTRYLLLFDRVLLLWGALSDKMTGLSFVRVIVCSSKSFVIMYKLFIFYTLNFQSIPIPVFSHILSARTTHRKHSSSIVARRRPHRKRVSRVRLRVHWSVTSTERGADNIENTASSIVACWTVFTELLPGKSLIKRVTINSVAKLYNVKWMND